MGGCVTSGSVVSNGSTPQCIVTKDRNNTATCHTAPIMALLRTVSYFWKLSRKPKSVKKSCVSFETEWNYIQSMWKVCLQRNVITSIIQFNKCGISNKYCLMGICHIHPKNYCESVHSCLPCLGYNMTIPDKLVLWVVLGCHIQWLWSHCWSHSCLSGVHMADFWLDPSIPNQSGFSNKQMPSGALRKNIDITLSHHQLSSMIKILIYIQVV